MRINWLVSLCLVVGIGFSSGAQELPTSQEVAKGGDKVVKSQVKARRTVKERQVTLHGARNTRDLGGLPASSGMYVKDGVVYRSGALCYLNDEDVDILKDKNIKSVIELRAPVEIAREGRDVAAFTGSLQKVYNCPLVCTSGNGQAAYLSYIKKQNYGSIAQFFHILAEQRAYPVLFHCSAGKDRTGILAALLLELLGTPRPIIMDDYLQSQRNSEGLKVEADWLRTIFQSVDKEGGIDLFLKNRGVSSDDMRKIRLQLRTK